MYAFKLSGEKAAAVAPVICSVVALREVELQFEQMKSRFGESAVSEMMTVFRSGEMASTFPGAWVTLLTEVPVKTMRPCWPKSREFTPRYAKFPRLSNTNELGVVGSTMGVLATKATVDEDRPTATSVGVQVAVVAAHPVVVA
jgi:hypothetical protein